MFLKFMLAAFFGSTRGDLWLALRKCVYLAALNHVSAHGLSGGLVSIVPDDDDDIIFHRRVTGIHHFPLSPTVDIPAYCDHAPNFLFSTVLCSKTSLREKELLIMFVIRSHDWKEFDISTA